MSAGTFNLSRSIWDDDAFANDPFSEREAWIWMIGEAAWKPRSRRFGQGVVFLERGQLAGSVRFFAEAWQWSPSAVYRFLEKLKRRGMIDVEPGRAASIITLRRYDDYQGGDARGRVPAEQGGTKNRNTGETQAGTLMNGASHYNETHIQPAYQKGETPIEEVPERPRNTGETNENKGNTLKKIIDGGGGDTRARMREGPVSDSKEKTQAPRDAPTLRERILAAMKLDPSGLTGPNGRILGGMSDMHEARSWIELGLDEDEVVAVIAETMATKRDGPPASFRYFRAPMQRLAARKAEPPLAPATLSDTQGGPHAGRPYQPAPSRAVRAAAAQERAERICLAAALGGRGAPPAPGRPLPRDPDELLDRGRSP